MGKCTVRRVVLMPFTTNCYLITNEDTKETLIVDPSIEHEKIDAQIAAHGLKPVAILLTHGHFDHILAAGPIAAKEKIPVYAYKGENALMQDPHANRGSLPGPDCVLTADCEVSEGDTLELAGFSIRVLYTPGHTAGSCCYYLPEEGVLFAGDTLFRLSYGRTDLPTGNPGQIVQSVRRLLSELPEDTVVLPGHMGSTTIAFEKQYNPLSETAVW